MELIEKDTDDNFSFLSKELAEFENFLKDYFQKRFNQTSFQQTGLLLLRDSIQYTLFSKGKRFRPALCIGTCQALSIDYKKSFPLAAALELIHTASLIHDDLPCMDDDDRRRGKPSNHVVFSEDIALLAGDALLIDVFYLLCFFQQDSQLIYKVAKAASFSGMIGGQSLDMKTTSQADFSYIKKLYEMKTGALISASIEGVLCLKDVTVDQKKSFQQFAYYLGLAFQLADDIADKNSDNKATTLFHCFSEEQAIRQLNEWTEKSLDALNGIKATALKKLVHFNHHRSQ